MTTRTYDSVGPNTLWRVNAGLQTGTSSASLLGATGREKAPYKQTYVEDAVSQVQHKGEGGHRSLAVVHLAHVQPRALQVT